MTTALAIHKVTKRWTTKDGLKVRICDMTDDHLLNTIAMCQRMHIVEQQEATFPTFGGEMAQYYAEQDYDRFQGSGPEESFPLYDDLRAEAMRRELTLPENGRRVP